ncbi:hypothetical protein L1887_30497 [Cichorium endivia]|nr:hypothetical protein L1887_30497 [Cichorium endivia]
MAVVVHTEEQFYAPVKKNSNEVCVLLHQVMGTCDQALTACHVAHEVNIISKPALILVPTKNKEQYEWVSLDETKVLSYIEEDVGALAEDQDLCIGGDYFEILLQTSAVVKVIPYVKNSKKLMDELNEGEYGWSTAIV